MPENPWAVADRISDRIVDIMNTELETMRRTNKIEPLQLLAGQLLALKALQKTMPPQVPDELEAVLQWTDICLRSLMSTRPTGAARA